MCDFEGLYFNLRDELLNLFKEAEDPQPKYRLINLRSAKLCGLANLAKLVLYFEREGYLSVVNKEDSYKDWEIQIEPGILDLMFGYG